MRMSCLAVLTVFLCLGSSCCLVGNACRPSEARPPESQPPEARVAEATQMPAGDSRLPERIEPGWARSAQVETYSGLELYEYIDGAAEMYHKYGFVEAQAAEYRKGESAITADLYRFPDSDRAFGLYTTLRPEEPDTVAFGAEGFAFWPNLVFTSGPFVANVYGYDDSPETIAAVRAIAGAIEKSVGGRSALPRAFDAFPAAGRLPFTEKVYAEAFLGHGFLTDVYAVDYSAGAHRFTLFAADDGESAKFNQWRRAAGPAAPPGLEAAAIPAGLPETLVTFDSYRGTIVAGSRDGRLLGMIGFRPELAAELGAWLR